MRTKFLLLLLLLASPVMASNLPSNGMYPGMIFPFAGATCPNGSIPTDGSSILKAGKYAALYTAISALYGSVDATHFNAPNTQGLFLRSAGSQALGGLTYSGSLASKNNDTTKKNGIGLNDPGHVHNENANVGAGVGNGSNGSIIGLGNYGGYGAFTSGTGYNTSSNTTGIYLNGGDAETAPANLVVKYCIKY